MPTPLSDPGKKAILQLCYMAFRKVCPQFNIHDPLRISEFAEGLTEKIAEFIQKGVNNGVFEFHTDNVDVYDMFCAVLDEIGETLPLTERMNVKLTMTRLQIKETHAATTTHRSEGGDPTEMGC